MSGSDETRVASTSDLPEVRPFDGSGADKYYVPPNSSNTAQQAPHPERDGTGFAENSSTLPERTYKDEDKQAYEITYPVGYLDQNKAEQIKEEDVLEQKDTTHFKIKKAHLIWAAVATVVVIIAVVLGTVLGLRNRSPPSPSSSSTPTPTPTPSSNAESAIGGYLDPAYYSEDGAFNGTGVAIASAGTESGQGIYMFYQDYTGTIQYSLMNAEGIWNLVGSINANSHRALNGTPVSVVTHLLDAQLVWHLFYIDEDYYVRERVTTNLTTTGPTPIWMDGPLNELNLKTFEADRVGMTACYAANYYGQYSYDSTQATAAIHLWYASDGSVMQEYLWSNGTSTWLRNQEFPGIDGHASFGCQTWDTGMTEYIFFVNKNQEIGFYWKDNNRSAPATDAHPIGKWTQGNLDVASVYKASPIGYTNFLVYQSIDTSIRGVNVSFGAENTTLSEGSWILMDGNQSAPAIGGTQLAFSAIATASNGALIFALFQEEGNDVTMYTRDAFNETAEWHLAAGQPVHPSL